ncbi:hypothetical protein D3OALGA1CA_395 [Olavius algarvensis associated proteobacterium Delta 3]|nr:hypothetical protein D3OALGA1CA_395 [Olavius algarvensis associated proteobacterium Delta 3]
MQDFRRTPVAAVLNQTRLYYHTLRYLHPDQIICRIKRMASRTIWRLTGRRAPMPTGVMLRTSFLDIPESGNITGAGPWEKETRKALFRARQIREGRFRWLNREAVFGEDPGWNDKRFSRLWRYHLHYFGYVQDLIVLKLSGEPEAAYATFRKLARSWIRCNQRLEGDGWHPFTISERIVNWLIAAEAFKTEFEADDRFRRVFSSSVVGQAEHLVRNLEYDVRGNHLLKNLRGVTVALNAIPGSEMGKLETTMGIYADELAEQVLPDGGHFERNPGYHLEVLRDLIEVGVWLRRSGNGHFVVLDGAIRRMAVFLKKMLQSDFRIPLLKDTALNEGISPGDVLSTAAVYLDSPELKVGNVYGLSAFRLFGVSGWNRLQRWPVSDCRKRMDILPDSGFALMRDGKDDTALVLDFGKPCPEYLPAHAHADLLSYELVVHGRRVVVDSGVFEYAAGPWRDFFRSTRAHNTLSIGGRDQTEVWNSFRAARRATPGPVTWENGDDWCGVQGVCRGYSGRVGSPVHVRTLIFQHGCFWIILDAVYGNSAGSPVDSYIHLAPDLSLKRDTETAWGIQSLAQPLWITAFHAAEAELVRGARRPEIQGWYSEAHGNRVPNHVLRLRKTSDPGDAFGYVISLKRKADVNIDRVSPRGHVLDIHYGKNRFTLRTAGKGFQYSK